MIVKIRLASLTLLVLLMACSSLPPGEVDSSAQAKRDFNPVLDSQWIGNGIYTAPIAMARVRIRD